MSEGTLLNFLACKSMVWVRDVLSGLGDIVNLTIELVLLCLLLVCITYKADTLGQSLSALGGGSGKSYPKFCLEIAGTCLDRQAG